MDQANYKQDHHMAWTSVQAQAGRRMEVFATLFWTRSAASIYGLDYDPGALEPLLVGLDYRLMSSAFGGFSNLDVRQFVQTAGVNYRLTNSVVLTTTFELNRYNDRDPYLFDATGRYVSFAAGLNWIF